MSDRPRILLVDDDPLAVALTREALRTDFEFADAGDGELGLQAIAASPPDLVLLDVMMPGIDGYEVCRRIRADLDVGDLPVIFLSSLVGADERLAGYEAGGDDYLVKPMVPAELRSKISRVLSLRAERRQLRNDLSSAFNTALTAMSSAAEVGAVLQFLRTSFACRDYDGLGREVLAVTQGYSLDCSVQIRGRQPTVSLKAEGPCSPLEEAVLSNMSEQGRIVDFGARTAYSYPGATIIVRNMPRDDPDRYGRMKDNLALLAEGVDARVTALDAEIALRELLETTRRALGAIEARRKTQGEASARILDDFRAALERSMINMGLTELQESELAELASDAAHRATALYDEGLEADADMARLLELLHNAT